MWKALHTASLLAGSDSMVAVANALTQSIPCSECSGHYRFWIASHPLVAGTDMATWFLNLHNVVNQRNGSPTWTMDAMIATYGGATAASDALVALQSVARYLWSDTVVSLLQQILSS
jgi:hypothetical protein